MPKKTIKAKKREVVNDAMIKKADKVFLGTEDLKKGEEVGVSHGHLLLLS